jgi:hypothetical protein
MFLPDGNNIIMNNIDQSYRNNKSNNELIFNLYNHAVSCAWCGLECMSNSSHVSSSSRKGQNSLKFLNGFRTTALTPAYKKTLPQLPL